jgi:hypothetical protein
MQIHPRGFEFQSDPDSQSGVINVKQADPGNIPAYFIYAIVEFIKRLGVFQLAGLELASNFVNRHFFYPALMSMALDSDFPSLPVCLANQVFRENGTFDSRFKVRGFPVARQAGLHAIPFFVVWEIL